MPVFELMLAFEPMIWTYCECVGTLVGPRMYYCAHRIETRVVRSRGDSARFFEKSGRSTPSLLRPNLWVGEYSAKGAEESLAKAYRN